MSQNSPSSKDHQANADPAIEALVREVIGRVADKWTLVILEVLEELGTARFTAIGDRIGSISQKMLTKTLRQMEFDGLVTRTVFPVIPPRVEYALTDLGRSLSEAFCGVWIWAQENRENLEQSRRDYKTRQSRRTDSSIR